MMLIPAAFIALFFVYYIAGWFLDKNFRLTMRKTRLSSVEKVFLHFRGTGKNKDRGHAIICVRLEKGSFINILLGAVSYAAMRFIGGKLVILICGFLLLLSFGLFAFEIFMNMTKHLDRKQIIDKMDETGFEDYHVEEKTAPVSQSAAVHVPVRKEDTESIEDTRLTDKIKEVKSKGLLDDDIFSPFVTDVTSKFRGVKTESEFSDGTSIADGKEALKNLAEKQLKAESFSGVNHFEKSKNSYSDNQNGEDEFSVRGMIDRHKQDIDPGIQMRGVNKNKPVGKDDTQ